LDLNKLIKGCINQNRKSQEELYRVYKDILYVVSLKYCLNDAEAEDNLHDTFIEIFSNIKNFKGEGSFEGWIKRIAINKAINRYRSSSFLTPIIDDISDAIMVDESDLDVSLDYILSLVQELPNQYRLVFNLYELDDYSHKEISTMLSISESTSKSNLHRAKLILKDKISSKNSFHNSRTNHGK
jgi:RNA polymerase sigma factor (sigma-70 family)